MARHGNAAPGDARGSGGCGVLPGLGRGRDDLPTPLDIMISFARPDGASPVVNDIRTLLPPRDVVGETTRIVVGGKGRGAVSGTHIR